MAWRFVGRPFNFLRRMEKPTSNTVKNSPQSNLLKNYAAILRAMHDLVFVLDANRVFIDIFQPASLHLYIPPEAFLQKRITEITFPAVVTAEIAKKLDNIEATGTTQHIDYTLNMPEGSYSYSANISGIYSEANALEGFVMVVRDITGKVQQQNRYLAPCLANTTSWPNRLILAFGSWTT